MPKLIARRIGMFSRTLRARRGRVRLLLLAALAITIAIVVRAVAEPDEPRVAAKSGKYEGQVDPVKKNGPIFVDWPKPEAALVFTGEQLGYLEPCGCAGLDNMKGGLKRRHTMVKQLAAKGWPLVMMDAGGHSKGFGAQPKIKLQYSIDALTEIGYQAIGVGDNDLRFEMLSIAVNLTPNNMTSANVSLIDFDAGFSHRYKIVEAGGKKFGITHVLGESLRQQLPESDEIVSKPAEEALAEVLPKLKAEKCDQLVMMCYAGVAETKMLAAKFPDFDWVVAGKGGDEPPYQATTLPSGAQLIEVGGKGKYAVVVGLYTIEGQSSFRYQKVPLDIRFDDSPAMQQRMIKYQEELRTLGYEGLGVRPQAHPSGRAFAGTKTCEDCHYEEFEIFEKTPHAHATKTIVDLEPARHFDPECISCHVTGWNDPKYVPWEGGFESLEKTPHLTGQGCENCHGPAARHAAAENGDIDVTDEELEALRKELHMEIVENEGNKEGQVEGAVTKNCMECHDLDNSPDFDFQEYWPAVKH